MYSENLQLWNLKKFQKCFYKWSLPDNFLVSFCVINLRTYVGFNLNLQPPTESRIASFLMMNIPGYAENCIQQLNKQNLFGRLLKSFQIE